MKSMKPLLSNTILNKSIGLFHEDYQLVCKTIGYSYYEFDEHIYTSSGVCTEFTRADLFKKKISSGLNGQDSFLANFKIMLQENDCANLASTPGMGAIVSAQPSSTPGVGGSIGSGDVSHALGMYTQPYAMKNADLGLPLKKKRRKKKVKLTKESLEKENEFIYNKEQFEREIKPIKLLIGTNALEYYDELANYISSRNSTKQDQYELIKAYDIYPSSSALSNKGIVMKLEYKDKIIKLNITSDSSDNDCFYYVDEEEPEKRNQGNIKQFLSFLLN